MSQGTTTKETPDKVLFWGCFIALCATSFGFIARALTAGEWGAEFGLTETQVGEILGAGLWPFAISIILFSLIIDKIGYKVAMFFGLFCHVASTVVILSAQGYATMYLGTFILALGSGTVEAYINPVVATMFNKEKSKWLNILHAGWPGGLAIGGMIILVLVPGLAWKMKIALIFIPTIIYAVMLFNKRFPVNERVAAGVSYKDMLKEVGALGALIASALIFRELGRLFGWPEFLHYILVGATTVGFFLYTRSLGQPLFVLLLLIMMPLATTELGVDSWITQLMESSMREIGVAAGWVLIFTSLIMMTLRFFAAGPLVNALTPLGLLAVSSVIAAAGLFALAGAAGALAILGAATLYGIGKTFFWPTTLGVVAEQFPRGGALTLNTVAGVGMLAVGIVGAQFLGNIQDKKMDQYLSESSPAVHEKYMTQEMRSVFGEYQGLDQEAIKSATPEEQETLEGATVAAQKNALTTVAILPIIMLVFYIGLIIYFRSKGGYKPLVIHEEAQEEAAEGISEL